MQRVRSSGALRLFRTIVVSALTVLAATAAHPPDSCIDAIPSGQQRGTFEIIPLGDTCDGPPTELVLGFRDEEPLFRVGRVVNGRCVPSLETALSGAVVTLAAIERDFTSPAAASKTTYWLVSENGYLRVASGSAGDPIPPLNAGFEVTSIASSRNGRVFGIEEREVRAKRSPNSEPQYEFRLVDLQTRKSRSVPILGSGIHLQRGSDGQLYVRVLGYYPDFHCDIFEVNDSGMLVRKATCGDQPSSRIAVGAGGDIWEPWGFGVAVGATSADPSAAGAFKHVGPVYPLPCDWSLGVTLPRDIAADQSGNVWFVYGKLWHADSVGNVMSIDLPPGAGRDGFVETADGTLWFPGDSALFRFTPAP